MTRYIIMGAGGLAREVDMYFSQGHTMLIPKDREKDLSGLAGDGVEGVVAVGDPVLRKKLWNIMTGKGVSPATLISHSFRYYSKYNFIDPGCVICPGAMITIGIRLWHNVYININATIGHDTTIGPHSIVNPGANIGGNVTIGEGVLIGAGAVIKQDLTIGDWARIGSGANIVKDVPAGETWISPAARRMQ